jgi:hypothetical protein
MGDDKNLRRIDELLVAYAEVVDPEQKNRFLRAIVRGLTDEVAQVHVRLTKLTAALAMAVGNDAHMQAQEIRSILQWSDPRPEKREAVAEKRVVRAVSREPPAIGRLLRIAAVRGDR